MARKRLKPEALFYQSVYQLVQNMFTESNPNIKSYYYAKQGGFVYQDEVKKMAALVLEKMEDWKHLLDIEEEYEEVQTTKTP